MEHARLQSGQTRPKKKVGEPCNLYVSMHSSCKTRMCNMEKPGAKTTEKQAKASASHSANIVFHPQCTFQFCNKNTDQLTLLATLLSPKQVLVNCSECPNNGGSDSSTDNWSRGHASSSVTRKTGKSSTLLFDSSETYIAGPALE